jgi:2-hydroxychromene-2-carboxylate isomerase
MSGTIKFYYDFLSPCSCLAPTYRKGDLQHE